MSTLTEHDISTLRQRTLHYAPFIVREVAIPLETLWRFAYGHAELTAEELTRLARRVGTSKKGCC